MLSIYGNISIVFLARLCKELDISADYLLFGNDWETEELCDDEIKLTTTDNVSSSGIPFPETPRPQIIRENFGSYEVVDKNDWRNVR